MEAVEFIRQKDRMCEYYDNECTRKCSNEICPAQDMDCNISTNMPECLVEIVEKWAKEHPEETAAATTHNNAEPCVKTIQDELEGAIYRGIAYNKTRIENLEYDVSVIRHNLSALHDKIYTLSEKVDHAPTAEPRQTQEPKRTNKDVLFAVLSDAKTDCDGIPLSCPGSLYESYPCYKFVSCNECRHTHWLAEVEE